MKSKLLPTSLVGSYPQPDWLIDRSQLLKQMPPRVRMWCNLLSRPGLPREMPYVTRRIARAANTNAWRTFGR